MEVRGSEVEHSSKRKRGDGERGGGENSERSAMDAMVLFLSGADSMS